MLIIVKNTILLAHDFIIFKLAIIDIAVCLLSFYSYGFPMMAYFFYHIK